VKLSELTTVPDQVIAEMWAEMLQNEGIDAYVAAGDTASYLGLASTPCRILVAEAILERAQAVLAALERDAREATPSADPADQESE